jgi:predicted AAA+ superfamily ATPase
LEMYTSDSDVGVDFRTLNSYLSVLTNTYIVKFVPPYYTKRHNEIKKS